MHRERLMIQRVTVGFLRGMIRIYQWFVSPLLPSACRFLPTCSDYAVEALQVHGAAKGTALTIKRVCRCHPLGGEGFDPVPQHGDMKG